MTPFSVVAGRTWLPALAVVFVSLLGPQDASALDVGRPGSIAGSGPVVTEHRDVERFQALRLDTDARVVVRQGDRVSVEVRAEGNVASLIETRVEDGTLVVTDRKRFKSSSAEVVVTARRIESIATRGSVSVLAQDLTGPSLRLSLGGSSAVTVRSASLVKLHASLGGSSALKLSGTTDELVAQLGGSSVMQAAELAAGAVSIQAGGSAQAVVWAKGSLLASLGGSSGLGYYGQASPTVATAGSATVKSLGDAPAKQP